MFHNIQHKCLVTSTLDAVDRKIRELPPCENIVIQSGINDLMSSTMEQVKLKINNVIKTAKSYHPTANIYMCSILTRNDKNKEINDFINSTTTKYGEKYIDTTHVPSELFRDAKHPNERGTAIIVGKIKKVTGMSTITPKSKSANYQTNDKMANNMYNRSYDVPPPLQKRPPTSNQPWNAQGFHHPPVTRHWSPSYYPGPPYTTTSTPPPSYGPQNYTSGFGAQNYYGGLGSQGNRNG